MYLIPSYVKKILFLCFRPEKLKHFRKNGYFWKLFSLILVIIYCVFQFNSNSCSLKPFIFKKRFKTHSRIMSYDRFMAMNNRSIDFGKPEYPHYKESTKFCYINKKLLGPRKVIKTKLGLDLKWVEDQLPMVRSGGFYAPENCRSRHKVAIIVPYRDRYDNLIKFLYYMHPLWQKQYLQYRLFVIEQYGNYKFNKGALYNVAFIETQRFGTWDCLVFHDVDLIALDERLLYTCPRSPTHMSPAIDCRKFKLQYMELFGGVTAMTPRHYLKTNGYSNHYWNWGAEDDDMYQRLVAARLSMTRLNLTIARFAALPHKRQKENPKRYHLLADARIRYKSEGLNTVQYRVHAIKKRKLFTHIIVNIDPFSRFEEINGSE